MGVSLTSVRVEGAVEVDVGIAQRAPGHGIATNADGGHWPHLEERMSPFSEIAAGGRTLHA